MQTKAVTRRQTRPLKPYCIAVQFRYATEPEKVRRCLYGYSDLLNAKTFLPSHVDSFSRDPAVLAVEDGPRIVCTRDLTGRDRAEFLMARREGWDTAVFYIEPTSAAPLEA